MPDKHEGREQRFNRVYRETRGEIMAYLLRRAHTVEDAADALSETYAAAWRKLDSLPTGNQTRLWLFGAARMELRIAARRDRAEDELIAELASELRAAHSQQIREADGDESLWSALSGLSSLDREIVSLTAWEELSPREIATVMGLSANVVRVRLHRARRELRARVERENQLQTHAMAIAPRAGR